MRRVGTVVTLLLALLLASACGGEEARDARSGGGETASLWITRDRGSEVVLTAAVPAGVTVLQALDREAEIETRYGGRFVQAIEGIDGSVARQEDWFYFVNGIQPDVGAADVRLHAGDVAWWDFRSWRGADLSRPVAVVGAFPEPFAHGWGGKRRGAEVRGPSELAPEVRALERALGASGAGTAPHVFALEVVAGARGAVLAATRGPRNDGPVTFTLEGSLAAVGAAARALAREPSIVRYRYTARFDDEGRVAR